MRPSDPVRHLTSLRKRRDDSTALALSTGASLSRDGDVLHAERVQLGLHLGFAITAIGGDGSGHLAEKLFLMRPMAGASIGASGGLPISTLWSTTMPSVLSATWAL